MKPSNLKSGKPWKLGRSQKVFIFRGEITLLRSGQKKIIFKGGRGGGGELPYYWGSLSPRRRSIPLWTPWYRKGHLSDGEFPQMKWETYFNLYGGSRMGRQPITWGEINIIGLHRVGGLPSCPAPSPHCTMRNPG